MCLPIKRKGVPVIPCLALCKLRYAIEFIEVPPPHTHTHLTNTHLRDPLHTYIISILHAPQSHSEAKQMLLTDRQLRQMTCLGNGLSLFGLTERLSEFQLGAFASQNSVRKRITWIQHTWIEDILSKVGFSVSYIIGLCTPDGMLEEEKWCDGNVLLEDGNFIGFIVLKAAAVESGVAWDVVPLVIWLFFV